MCRRFFRSDHGPCGSAGSRHRAEPMFRARRVPTWRWRRCAACRLSHGRRAKMRSPIGAVGEHLPRIVRKSSRTRPAIIDAGRRDRDFLDQRGVGVGADMRFETMNGKLALVLHPMALVVFLGRRARRQQACRHYRRIRRHHRQEMRRSRERTRCHQKPRRAPLVAKNRQCEAIRRKPYQKPLQLLVIAKPSRTEENLVIGI